MWRTPAPPSTADGGRFHLVGTGGSEDLAGTGGIEHALAHKSTVQGFVTAAAARNDAHLAGDGGVRPNHVHRIEADLEDFGVGCGEPSQRFTHHIPRGVDQFLHVRSTKKKGSYHRYHMLKLVAVNDEAQFQGIVQ